jgi:phosphate transport system substrate-binding protein
MKNRKQLFILTIGCLVFWQCGTSRNLASSTTIRLKGSDTMIILAELWAEEYMKANPGISVYADGGGTATGVEALIKGEVDICTASRPINPGEARRLVQRQGYLGFSILVAKDALSIYLHPENPVRNLTAAQVKDIYTGKISIWKEVGGKDAPIVLLSRSPNSGTYLYFQEHVLEEQPYSPMIRTMPGTEAIAQAVAENPDAIGYGGIAYGQNLVHCKINGVAPSEANVRNDSYPISRYLYLYTIKEPGGNIKKFIDWVLSKDGQTAVKKIGYVPLREIR